MLVSIVTVSYNSEKTIRKTIESVLNQTYGNIEYLIVDGKSSDNTVCIAKEYEKDFAKKNITYKIISEKDNGIYDAMNKGIRMANGAVVGIINSDDWFEKHAIETVVRTYEEEPFDYFYADINLIKQDGTIIRKRSREDKIVSSRHWNHPTSFVTKETYNDLGMFACKEIYDDFDFYLRARKAGKKMVIKNEILANFCVGGVSNQKSIKKCIKRIGIKYRCYKNNHYSPLYMIECVLMEVAKMILS